MGERGKEGEGGWGGGGGGGRRWRGVVRTGREGRHRPGLNIRVICRGCRTCGRDLHSLTRLEVSAGQGARTAGITETQGQVTSLTQQLLVLVIMVVINVTVLVLHVLVLLPGQRLAHRSGHAGSLAGQRNHLLGFVLHGCQGLLDRLLPHLTVIPADRGSQYGVRSELEHRHSDRLILTTSMASKLWQIGISLH